MTTPVTTDPAALVAAVRDGDRRALARALSVLERAPAGPLAAQLFRDAGRAHIVGITGPPGCGKSTLGAAVTGAYRARGRTVGVVAVDPSSPYTGGAVLGDRVRMGAHSGDPGVFIRSMAARGRSGGLALATSAAVRALDVAGFEVVLVETVGAGQTEVEIAQEAHTTVVVLGADMGDAVQALKAGILEIADVFAVNKADLPASERVAAQLETMLTLGEAGADGVDAERGWQAPVVRTVATRGEGIEELVDIIVAHADHLRTSGGWTTRARARVAAELERLVQAQVRDALFGPGGRPRLERTLDRLAAREIDPQQATVELISAWRHGGAVPCGDEQQQ